MKIPWAPKDWFSTHRQYLLLGYLSRSTSRKEGTESKVLISGIWENPRGLWGNFCGSVNTLSLGFWLNNYIFHENSLKCTYDPCIFLYGLYFKRSSYFFKKSINIENPLTSFISQKPDKPRTSNAWWIHLELGCRMWCPQATCGCWELEGWLVQTELCCGFTPHTKF